MKSKPPNSLFLIFLLPLIGFVYYCKDSRTASDYYNPKPLATYFDGEQYVGSEACAECHHNIYSSHVKTAHYNTSSPATQTSIKGGFDANSNMFELNKTVKYVMTSEGSDFYQNAETRQSNRTLSRSKMDIVIGSGVKGQSYLTWEDDKLFQLQGSYFTSTNSWVNSPGFPSGVSNRPVSDACLKCHVTFAKNHNFSGKGNQYYKKELVYGVDCERCHGPSSKHVVYQRSHPKDKIAKFVINTEKFSRQQRLDACAVCHSGLRNLQVKGNPFSFQTGDTLSNYSRNYNSLRPNQGLDVHGNQYGLLISSKCFKQTEKMDCTTCHDPHKKQRGNTSYFNQKCVECHNTNTIMCTVLGNTEHIKNNNCIACHMPLKPSKSMTVQLDKDSLMTPVNIRTHLIAIYPQKSWNIDDL